jgi:hypothetical protein
VAGGGIAAVLAFEANTALSNGKTDINSFA